MMRGAPTRVGSPWQQARLRGWLARCAMVSALLAICMWGWAGYQAYGAQGAIAELWSMCTASLR